MTRVRSQRHRKRTVVAVVVVVVFVVVIIYCSIIFINDVNFPVSQHNSLREQISSLKFDISLTVIR